MKLLVQNYLRVPQFISKGAPYRVARALFVLIEGPSDLVDVF